MARFGLSVAITTPFAADGGVDLPRLCAHATNVLSRGVESVTLFGTTGEGASIGHDERHAMLGAMTAVVSPADIVAGICATASASAVTQVAQATGFGVRRFLLTPPFYFKDVEDSALFDWLGEVIGKAPQDALFIPYNIPQLTGVPISPDLLGRLCDAFPGRIIAVKDSSGSRASAEGFLQAGHAAVLVGDERLLPRAMREGAGGAISGMANLHPEEMRRIVDHATDEPALMAAVEAAIAGPVVASIKAILARDRADPDWERMRPPLGPLSPEARERLYEATDAAFAASAN